MKTFLYCSQRRIVSLVFNPLSQIMKTSVTLNERALLRVLFAVLITCTPFLAMPGRAQAQLYVSSRTNGTVSEYNATTGAVINANFITGLTAPEGLLLLGDVLFVANFGSGSGGWVGKYDATTGAAISQSFLTGTDLVPSGLASSGGDIWVVNLPIGQVFKYNAKGEDVKNYVEAGDGSIGDLAFFGKNIYFLSDTELSQVDEIETKTGVQLNTFNVTGPLGIAILGNTLFVGSYADGTIAKYSAKTLKLIKKSFIKGLQEPFQIALLGDTLFVANGASGTVGEYDAKTGATINASFVSGLSGPWGVAVRAEK
jgi:WD40 repeat protein